MIGCLGFFNVEQDMNVMPQNTVFSPSGLARVVVMDTPPPIPKVFVKLITLSMIRPSTLGQDTVLEKICLVYPGVTIDPEKVNRFKQVCGYDQNRSGVPATYIQSLLIGMMSQFISSSFFPINPMGLIQTGQSFELVQPVAPGMKLDLYCRMLDMTRTEKGIVSRFLMEATVADDHPENKGLAASDEKELVWQGIATYLTRSKSKKPKEKKQPSQDIPLPVKEIIEVPENTGRSYARVSRDFNPHHLYTWTALPMGFKTTHCPRHLEHGPGRGKPRKGSGPSSTHRHGRSHETAYFHAPPGSPWGILSRDLKPGLNCGTKPKAFRT